MTASAFYPGDEDVLCHIVPLGDFREHELSLGCWCHPAQHAEHSDVVVHNAMDQREKIERGEAWLQ